MQKNTYFKLDEQFFIQFNRAQAYKKGEMILRAQEEPKEVYFLKKGFVRLYLIALTGREITFNIYKPGTYFPMIWAIGNLPNFYFFESLTDTVVYRAPREKLLELVKNNPKLLFALTKRTYIGLDGIVRLTQALLTENARGKLISVLLVLGRRFGRKETNGDLVIRLPLTHRILASLANLSRETTSLALEKLQKEKVLTFNKHSITINKLQKIEEESSIVAIEKATNLTF
ncbi:hypothetical protein A2362_02380 [Candidatus Curtissbacteria bacterium RIFOXYB1_FULL_41_59]|nr:MAG: hypothetical protein UT95_C0062G0008 [Candidatus Curtissbacteria bacterium GW2011_GWB1_40_28]KKS00860.1 MAG: hypothetical protein UU53_C0026G0023 [Candidatus Curtissbacteria bacterium GW2011_GWC2_41_21]OGD81318.1 MAG: hypothetical protein A2683_01240 [Candidatus Curtissbacteria bacterium RIFCSPHIGHO2_01_FULL_34_40]OGE05863.1 MAG: hypothetical protein A2362_02380 [Candidatus Curtissbacteria bacterium RIFOXYB1_FULL_41_59]OGE12565.1 MAG: hypothetical protein A2305_02320 [Candidatus Curtiss